VDGDDEFDEFVRSRAPALTRFAFLLCGDEATAQDLVQSALARTMMRWRRVDPGRLEAYVKAAIVNEQRALWRRPWRRAEISTGVPPERAGEDSIDRLDERDALRRALLRLPIGQRTAIALRYFDDLTEAEAAVVMNCSVGMVKSQTFKGLARLRTELSRERSERMVAGC
jgi:RNA polymerase sigma-70 factor (sigma-E family)